MKFRLRLLDEGSWALRDVLVEAASPEAAQRQLGVAQARVLRIEHVAGDHAGPAEVVGAREPDRPGWPGRWRTARLDVAWWCRELRVLLVAGMTVVEAIDTLALQAGDAARMALHERLARSLAAGQSLSVAMAGTGVFPQVLVAGVVASERTGALTEALDDYLRYHDMTEQLRRRLVSAALYPLLVAAVGLGVVLFLLWFVVPRFAATYAELQGSVSLATQALVRSSTLLRDHAGSLGWGLLALLGALAWAWRAGGLPALLMRLADALPPVRRVLDDFRLAKLYHALALMFRGGFTLPEALQRCQAIGLGSRWSGALQHAREALEQGHSVSRAFVAAGLSDAVAARLLVVGERTGSFTQVLQTVAERHGSRFATVVERLTRLAEPLLLLGVALSVGAVVVLMYLPIFDLASSLR